MWEFINDVFRYRYPGFRKCLNKTARFPYIVRNTMRAFYFIIYMPKLRKEKKQYMQRYLKLCKNGMIMNLTKEHSDTKFWLPLLTLENGRVCGEYIQREIFMAEDYFEAASLQELKSSQYIKEGMNVLDIGANIGNHTLFYVKECKAGHVYSFEPMAETYKMLCRNIELNGLENVTLYNFALGKEDTSVSVKHFDRENYGGTALEYGGGVDTGMECRRLDGLLIDRRIDFIKIDVEGFENEVLHGGAELIRRDKPVIYVEIFQENRDKVENTLRNLGYSLKEKKEDDYLFLPK